MVFFMTNHEGDISMFYKRAANMIRKNMIIRVMLLLTSASFPTVGFAQENFSACLAGLKSQAAGRGISASTFDNTMRGVTPDLKVIELMDAQPEFKTPIWDYLAALVDDEKIAEGRYMLRQWGSALAQAEAKYGVDRHTILAVWGVESDFGKQRGKWALPQALSTLACFAPRRRDYFKGELFSAMTIVQRGDISADKLMGSWAGAFGHTQFMPSTYLSLAVDGDGDGRRDLVDSIPDALHSTAHFLKKAGWNTGASWGYEVALPSGYAGPSGRKAKESLSAWSARGLTKVDGSALSGSGSAGLLLPAGKNGPAFLVFRNYDAAYSYNGADSYALAISHLSDRLRGKGGLVTAWPTDDLPLSREERRELQRLLTAKGYDVGEPTGAIGPKTREAVKQEQQRYGHTSTGRAGMKVLEALRAGR
jgi:lytic murein transglycosylase